MSRKPHRRQVLQMGWYCRLEELVTTTRWPSINYFCDEPPTISKRTLERGVKANGVTIPTFVALCEKLRMTRDQLLEKLGPPKPEEKPAPPKGPTGVSLPAGEILPADLAVRSLPLSVSDDVARDKASRSVKFVGRDYELKAVEKIIIEKIAPAGGVLAITGNTGIGKTSFLYELYERLR